MGTGRAVQAQVVGGDGGDPPQRAHSFRTVSPTPNLHPHRRRRSSLRAASAPPSTASSPQLRRPCLARSASSRCSRAWRWRVGTAGAASRASCAWRCRQRPGPGAGLADPDPDPDPDPNPDPNPDPDPNPNPNPNPNPDPNPNPNPNPHQAEARQWGRSLHGLKQSSTLLAMVDEASKIVQLIVCKSQ